MRKHWALFRVAFDASLFALYEVPIGYRQPIQIRGLKRVELFTTGMGGAEVRGDGDGGWRGGSGRRGREQNLGSSHHGGAQPPQSQERRGERSFQSLARTMGQLPPVPRWPLKPNTAHLAARLWSLPDRLVCSPSLVLPPARPR